MRLVLYAFENEVVCAVRSRGHSVISIGDEATADYPWRELLTVTKPPLYRGTARFDEVFDIVRRHAAVVYEMYSRHFVHHSIEVSELHGLLDVHTRFALALLESEPVDAVVFATFPHEGYDHVLYLVAGLLGVRRLVCYQSPFPDRFWILRDGGRFRDIDLSAPGPQPWLTDRNLPTVNVFYTTGISGSAAYKFGQALWQSLVRPVAAPSYVLHWQKSLIYRCRLRRAVRNIPPAEIRCAYFPLHFQPELTTSALGGGFVDQVRAIESLRDVLDDDICILVKENPLQSEMVRGRLFFERLAKVPRTFLVPTTTTSADLIRRCFLTATISGTAGWEALVAGKPVVLFGNGWYDGFSGVTPYESLRLGAALTMPDADLLHSQLKHRMDRSFHGVVDSDYNLLAPGLNETNNAAFVADAILEVLRSS